MIEVIRDDPFASINQIKQELRRRMADGSITWWRVFRSLWRRRLLTKQARFRYVWGHK